MPYIVKPIDIDCDWYGQSACPLVMQLTGLEDAGGVATASVDFAGRGKVGGFCGGSDQYITFTTNGTGLVFDISVDIWGALRDGAWSSSTTILIYVASTLISATDSIQAAIIGNAASIQNKTIIFQATGICPTVLKATVTIMDDGSFIIS